jgi:hypothetical protein
VVDARGDRDLVPEVPRELHHVHGRVLGSEGQQAVQAAVRAAVIDEQDLVIQIVDAGADRLHPFVERVDPVYLVVDRNDDRQHLSRL